MALKYVLTFSYYFFDLYASRDTAYVLFFAKILVPDALTETFPWSSILDVPKACVFILLLSALNQQGFVYLYL